MIYNYNTGTTAIGGPQFPSAVTTGPAAIGFTTLAPQTDNIPKSAPYPSYVKVNPDGSLLVSGCSFANTLSCDASNITFTGCQFTAEGFYAVQPGGDAAGPWSFRYCQASAPDSSMADDLFYGFPLPDGLSNNVRSVVDHCNIFWFSAQSILAVNNATISNNYLHDMVQVDPNHAEPIYLGIAGGGASCANVTVTGNTILTGSGTNNTAAIYLDAHGNNYDNYVITNNLVGGGDYCIYCGVFSGYTVTNEIITDNWFSTLYYADGGQFGYAVDTPTWGTDGNYWARNRWYDGPDAGQYLGKP